MTVATASATQTVLEPGTVVRTPRFDEGKNTGVRRAIVLGLWNENAPKDGYRVWFYTLGAPSFAPRTLGMSFANEFTVVGTVDDMSERTLIRLYQWLRDLDQFGKVRSRVQRAGLRRRALRLGR
ncbi:DUF6409 family protein (plasmid) [Streptomyces goshikiensis]|uniref:DUF6409 family protein n=1 Tax=Streptomyces TaxID=1883 RepID=UPI000C278441|nr:DUF6409 family protein [Streptomyces sp. CB02120-2]PJN14519.1 hypothetical protein CG724_33030 [Streptomyces sp. CB02120-2]WSY03451.1 DUF6409 family protein [Streptomyces goshikiensis]